MARVTLRGRAAEMSVVLSALRQVRHTGHGAVLAVVGEPGIGKTTLLRDASEQAQRQGYAVGTGKTEEIDQIAPGGPLLVALRSGPRPLMNGTAFAALAPMHTQQLWLVDRIAEYLGELAGRRPVLIALDDVQWADPVTRFALRTLPSRLAALPVLWLLTSRLAPIDSIEETLAALDPSITVARVTLGPITGTDIDELAAELLGEAPDGATQELLRGVSGNPFWAVQVLTSLIRRRDLGLPPTDLHIDLISGLRQRLLRLPEDVVAVIRVAAVCGRLVSTEAVGALLDSASTDRVLEAAVRGREEGLLTIEAGGVALPHDLIRETVYADIPTDERGRLHRARGQQLMAEGASVLLAAPHFLASSVPDDIEAVDVILRAATESAGVMPEQAARLAQRAFGLLRPGHPQRLKVGERALAVLVDAQRNGDVLKFADVLLPLATPAGIARIEISVGEAMWQAGSGGALEQRMDRALTRKGVPPAERVRLRALRALASTRTGRPLQKEDSTAEVGIEAIQLHDLPAHRTVLLALTEAARNTGEHQKALDYFDQLRAISPKAHIAERIRGLQHLDRYDDAGELLAEAHRAVDGNRDRLLPSYLFAQAWQDHNLGNLAAAEITTRTLLRHAEAVENYAFIMNARMILCGLAIYRGDLAEARDALAPVERLAPEHEILRSHRMRITQAWLIAEEGDPRAALAIARPLLFEADNGSHPWAWSPGWMRTFAGIARRAGDEDVAERVAWIAQLGSRRTPGVATIEALALQVRGYLDGDPDVLHQAVSVMRRSPRRLLLAWALRDLGLARVAAGDQDGGQEVLQEATQIYQDLGAQTQTQTQAQALTGMGHRRRTAPHRPVHGWESLTDAETRVAELVIAGHTNRYTAQALGVSTNTVGSHLRSIFAKLEVRSRVQLANRVREQRAGSAGNES